MSYILPVILFSYNNIFFVMVIGFVFYYLIFKRWFRFIEIESTTAYENETESRSDSSTKFCSSPDCVRCTLYRSTILLAKDRLLEIKPGNEEVVKKVEEAFITLPLDRSSTFSQNPNVFFYHELQSAPFWETEIFDDSRILESNFNTILSEFQNIVHNKQTGVWKRNETPSGAWEVFHLVNQGTRVEQNSQLCPETMSIISALSSAMTRNVFGNVTFSVIHPSTVISEHYGPTNIRLRCHLGLVCDASYCLSVSDQTRCWETGKTLVFDDSFLHSVCSSGVGTAHLRAVLIVDIWHPDLTSEEREIMDTIFAPCS